MKKRILSMLLTAVLTAVLAVPALAGGTDLSYPYLSIDSANYALSADASGTGWSWSTASQTLTLNGYNGGDIEFNGNYQSGFSLKMTLSGTNIVDGQISFVKFGKITTGSDGSLTHTDGGTFTISGSGSLTIKDQISSPRELIMQSGTVIVQDDGYGRGLYGELLTMNGGELEINAAGNPGTELVLNGGLLKFTGNDRYSFDEPITFNGGSMSVDSSYSLPDSVTGTYTTTETGDTTLFTSTGTGASTTPSQTVGSLAYASTQSVNVDGKAVEFQMYALKDANGNDTNYVKVRDVAYVLNGTQAQFSVGWDGSVNLVPGAAYTSNGSEMSTPFSGNRSYTAAQSVTNVSGAAADMDAIVLTDDAGGGYTYYKLRDLGAALGFNVGWSAKEGVYIETDKPYQG